MHALFIIQPPLANTFLNMDWHGMFFVSIPLIFEKMLRPIVIYIFLIAGLRLAGKRELAQLNPFDLIVLLTLSNTVQNAIIGNDNTISGGIIGAGTLLVVNHFFVNLVHRYKWMQNLVAGKRDTLMRDGKLLSEHLDRELMTRAELTAAAHKQGIASLKDVQNAYIEPTGTITFKTGTPSPDDTRHSELLKAIGELHREITELHAVKKATP